MPTDDPDQAPFQPLGNYEWPSMPADDVARSALTRLKRLFAPSDPAIVADKRLKRATRGTLDHVVPRPASGPLVQDLEETFGQWAGEPSPTRLNVVVLPPCDQNDILHEWAKSHGHELLPPPDRAGLFQSRPISEVGLAGEGLLVIPALERWFLRNRLGLAAVRSLLTRVSDGERKCLVACNSWAWAFLNKAIEVELLLPHPLTIKAFDATRLRQWFAELAAHAETETTQFRFTASGKEIDLADPESPADDYFKKLAARSLGIPWVAWHQWRQSLRSRAQNADEAVPGESPKPMAEQQTLWIAELEEFTLPSRHEPDELIILQALLIHGALSLEELESVVPVSRVEGISHALLGAGLVERRDGQFRCRPAAYPSVRAGLSAAGFPIDEL